MRAETILRDVPATELAQKYWEYCQTNGARSGEPDATEDAFMFARANVIVYANAPAVNITLDLTDKLYRIGLLIPGDRRFAVTLPAGTYTSQEGVQFTLLDAAYWVSVYCDSVNEVVFRIYSRKV